MEALPSLGSARCSPTSGLKNSWFKIFKPRARWGEKEEWVTRFSFPCFVDFSEISTDGAATELSWENEKKWILINGDQDIVNTARSDRIRQCSRTRRWIQLDNFSCYELIVFIYFLLFFGRFAKTLACHLSRVFADEYCINNSFNI